MIGEDGWTKHFETRTARLLRSREIGDDFTRANRYTKIKLQN